MATVIRGSDNFDSATVGVVVQTHVEDILPITRSTAGSWSSANTITSANTYQVSTFSFTKTKAGNRVIGFVMGHVDTAGSSGVPTVVCMTGGNTGTHQDLVLGAAYRHVSHFNTEPFGFNFNFEDVRTELTQDYSLRCHSSASAMYFSRFYSSSTGQNPFRIVLMEISV